MNATHPTPRLLALALLAGLLAAPAFAQGVYRIVGPDGKVTFADDLVESVAAALHRASTR